MYIHTCKATHFFCHLEEEWHRQIQRYSRKRKPVLNSSVGSSSLGCALMKWTPQSPHCAADSQLTHSHFLRCWRTRALSFLSLLSFHSLSLSFPAPPLSILRSWGIIVAPVCALFDVVLGVNRRGKHLTQLLNRERLNVP